MTAKEKECVRCHQTKPLTEFHRSRAHKDGHRSICKTCAGIAAAKWDEQHPEKKRERNRRYNQRYRATHPEAYRAAVKSYRERNPEKLRRWRVVAAARRRARLRESDGRCSPSQWEEIVQRYASDGRCPACGEHAVMTIDHVIPLSCGGTNDPSNLQPLCARCNSIKGTGTQDYRAE